MGLPLASDVSLSLGGGHDQSPFTDEETEASGKERMLPHRHVGACAGQVPREGAVETGVWPVLPDI